eukprot:1400551-Rhodomonas_salina.1
MSSFQWLNNCIPKFHAKNDYPKIAKLPEFVVWKDDVGVPVDAQGHVDYESETFARAVVGLSMLCGNS